MKEVEIIYNDVPLRVVGEYIEGESEIQYYPDMSGQPSSPPDFEIDKIFVLDSDINIVNIFYLKDFTEIRDLVIEEIEE